MRLAHPQDAQPRLTFALASAVAAAVEGDPGAADVVVQHGGVRALVSALHGGGGKGKRAAAQAIQVGVSGFLGGFCIWGLNFWGLD